MAIKKATGRVNHEEATLRAQPGDGFFTPSGSEIFGPENVGHFWGIHETRPYMRARYALVEALLVVETYAAVDAAHVHIIDILRLCTSDNMGLRDRAPNLKLRLQGREAECYDFCKAWVVSLQGDFDGDEDNGFWDMRGGKEDGMKNPRGIFDGEFLQLGQAVSVTLIKVRLLQDMPALKTLQLSGLGKRVPVEIEAAVKEHLVVTSIIIGKRDIMKGVMTGMAEELESQIRLLIGAVAQDNKYFWPMLRSLGNDLRARPDYYSPRPFQEAQIQLMSSYDAWAETEGAFDVLEEMMNLAGESQQ